MSGASTAHKLHKARLRIAELEAENARLREQLAARRDPASAISLHTALTAKPAHQASAHTIGFTKEVPHA